MYDDWCLMMKKIVDESKVKNGMYKLFPLFDAWHGPLEEKPQIEFDKVKKGMMT